MNDLWSVAGGIAVLSVTAAVAWRVYAARSRPPRSALEDPTFIAETLNKAIARRSRFNVQFMAPELNARTLQGLCTAVKTKTLRIDTDLSYSVPSWRNQQVRVSFNVTTPRGATFYSFVSILTDFTPQHGSLALDLMLPRQLHTEQRRAFVRLSPLRGMVDDLSMWTEEPAVTVITTPVSMPEPDIGFDGIDLSDISAGGARLLLLGKLCTDLSIGKKDIVRLHALLSGTENKGNLSLWLEGEVLMLKEHADGMMVTLRFRRWTQEGENSQAEFSWFPVNNEGAVPPLAAWVMHKHLEIHRDRTG